MWIEENEWIRNMKWDKDAVQHRQSSFKFHRSEDQEKEKETESKKKSHT